MPSGSCLSESVDIPLRSGQDSGWSEHDVRDRRSATWMSPRAVPVRIWDTISTSLGNSHSETLQLSEGILFVPGVRPVSQRSFTNFQVTKARRITLNFQLSISIHDCFAYLLCLWYNKQKAGILRRKLYESTGIIISIAR